MDDFDDIANVLNDLADFDVSSFSTPAPTPVKAAAAAPPKTVAPASPLNFDTDFGFMDSFDAPAQPAPTTSSFGIDSTDLDLDFSTDFGMPASTTTQAVTLDSFDFDLPPMDLDINLDASKPAAAEVRRPAPGRGRAMPAGRGTPAPVAGRGRAVPMGRGTPMNATPMFAANAPQVMNMQAANSPQVMNMQPANAQPMRAMNAPQVMNMQPANAPQVMNMQPANSPQPMRAMNAPQVMNMQPANAPQVMNMQPANSPQVMNMQPANSPQPMRAMNAPQVMNMQPANSPQVMNMQPANSPQVMNMQPANRGPQVMNMQPANAPQVMNMQAANSPQVMNMQPANAQPMRAMNAPQVMNMQAANSPQVMNMQPANGPQIMNMQAANSPQIMTMKPANAPQVMNMQPANSPQVMNMQPANSPQVMNMQPANSPQVMNMQAANSPQIMNMQAANRGVPQVMNMQPANAPQVMNMQAANSPQIMNMQAANNNNQSPQVAAGGKDSFTFKQDDEEWPDPVERNIVARELSEGRTKLILTLLLADKSTKKVFATDDFTISDLRDTFAVKLHLWQTEFFDLCVKDEDDDDRWLDLNKTILEEKIPDGAEVMLKIKYFKVPKKMVDQAAVRLYYIQVKQNIISGAYPTSEKLAIRQAAHQVQLVYGNYVPSKHHPGFLGDTLKDYLPREVLSSSVPTYLESRIYQIHRTLVGKSNQEVMESYLDLAQQIQTYGASIYLVKEKGGRAKRLGIAEDGILISTDDNPKKFDFFAFKQICGWNLVKGGFQIQVNNGNDLEFETTETKSHAIIELMCSYYIFLLGANVGDLPLVSLPMQPRGLPNPKMFHKPNTALKRNLSDQTQSRLEIFKDEFLSLSKKREIPLNTRVMLPADDALDQDLVLDEYDMSNCNVTNELLGIFIDAVHKAFDYEPKEEEFFEDNLTLSTINLSNNPFLRKGEAETFGRLFCSGNWRLKRVIAKDVGMTSKIAVAISSYLGKNDFLEGLDFENNDLKMKGLSSIMKALKGQDKCCAFNFNNNNIDKAGFFLAQVVAKNQKLNELRIGGNKFDEKQLTPLLEGLKLNTGLTTLDVSNCGFSTAGGRAILTWLADHRTLRNLYIGGNSLGNTFGGALVKLLKAGAPLMALDVSKTGIGAKAVTGILDAIKETRGIRELDISGNEFDKKGVQLLCDCVGSRQVNLRKLTLKRCGLGRGAMTALGTNMQQNTTLREVDVSGNDLKENETAKAWSDAIKNAQCLEILKLSGCGLAGEAFEILATGIGGNKSITTLYLDGNSKLGKIGFPALGAALANNETLQELHCEGIGLEPPVFNAFAEAISGKNFTLKNLHAAGNPALLKVDMSTILKKVSFSTSW